MLLPGVDDPNRVKSLIKSTAMLEFKHVEAGPFNTEEEAKAHYGGAIPEEMAVYKSAANRLGKTLYVLQAATVVPGKDVRNANRSLDQYGRPAVSFTLKHPGPEEDGEVFGGQCRTAHGHRAGQPHRECGND